MLRPGGVDGSCIKIKRVSESIDRMLNAELSNDDLTLTQCRVLYTLLHRTNDKTATQKEIEDYLSISHPTAVGVFHRLESKGLIENMGRTGKESKTLRITESGIEIIERNEMHMTRMEERIRSILGECDTGVFMMCLDRLDSELTR